MILKWSKIQRLGHFYLIAVDFDWAHVSGTYSCIREEAVFPVAHVRHAFVQNKESVDPARYSWTHAQQFTCKPSKQDHDLQSHTYGCNLLIDAIEHKSFDVWN